MGSAWPKPTDCPSCRALCLSPTILPCGHLLCRKCFRQNLEDKGHNPACPFCNHGVPRAQGQTISHLANQLGKDLILEYLVMEQLAGQGPVFCVACPKKVATRMCVDCGEMYCDGCSVSHKRMKMSKDHEQQDLPQALSNTSTPARSTDRPQRHTILGLIYHVINDSFSSSASQGIISSSSPQDSIRYDHNTGPRTRQKTDQASLQQEARLFKEEVSRLGQAVSVVRANMAQLQEVERRLEGQQQLLVTYTARLENANQALVASARTLLPRLKRVRQDCRPPPEAALISLTRHVNSLMQFGTDTDGIRFDPMTSVPTRAFTFTPEAAGDTHTDGPLITSIVATDDGRLVMTDWRNKMVKVATKIQAVKLETKPLKLSLLRDGQVAVTGDGKRIYFVNVTGTPTVVSHVPTKRQYYGVGALTDDDTLLAGCRKDTDGPSSVDVLTRAGVVLKSVIDSSSLAALSTPGYLYVQNRTVWVSEYEASAVFAVDVDTGDVITTYRHSDLNGPMQVAVDKGKNCYIVSDNGNCVLVVTSAGQWRRWLNSSEHGEATRVFPKGLCVTDWGVVVTWDGWQVDDSGPGSVVSGYSLI